MRLKRRSILGAVLVIALSILLGLRLYREFVPRGAAFYPWVAARVDGPTLTSPDGSRVVRVYFNDAGAMHSGNHWTWLVEDSWLWGSRVVDAGYLEHAFTTGNKPLPYQWVSEDELHMQFSAGRYEPAR